MCQLSRRLQIELLFLVAGDGKVDPFVSFEIVKLNAEVPAGAVHSAIQAHRLEAKVCKGLISETK